MKKKGFTLAEVLITLTVIGVVAAITLPSLTTNVQKTQTGSTLAKAINSLENANKMALVDYETTNLSVAANCITPNYSGANYMSILEKYVSGAPISPWQFVSKDGFTYSVYSSNIVGTSELKKYLNKSFSVSIDINGPKKPNKGGEDQFAVAIDYSGIVIPIGGQEMNRYNGNTIKLDCKSNPTGECTGNIVDNGWKVIY